LIQFNKNIDHIDDSGSTALHEVAWAGHINIALARLNAGADMNKNMLMVMLLY